MSQDIFGGAGISIVNFIDGALQGRALKAPPLQRFWGGNWRSGDSQGVGESIWGKGSPVA